MYKSSYKRFFFFFSKDFLLYDEKVKPIAPSAKPVDKPTNGGVELSIINDQNFATNNTGDNRTLVGRSNEVGVHVSNASAKWVHGQPENSLNDINLTVSPGRLVAIIGPVGAGKV